MPYIITIIATLTGLIRGKSKLNTSILLTLIIVIFGFSTWNADFLNYQARYKIVGMGGDITSELIFSLLLRAGNYLTLDFGFFRFIVLNGSFLIVYRLVRKYTDRKALVLALFIIFPALFFSSAIRNFLSATVIIYSYQFLVEDRKGNTFKYILGVVIASLIHSIAMFYILFLLAKVKSLKKLIIIISSSTVVLVIFQVTGLFTRVLGKFSIYADKFEKYFLSGNTFASINGLLVITLRLSVLLVVYLIIYDQYRKYRSYNRNNKKQNTSNYSYGSKDRFIDTTLKINIIMFLLIPIAYYSILFMRIMWNIMIINYVSYAVAESEMKMTKNKGVLNLRKMLYIIPPVIEFLIFTEFGQSQALETIFKAAFEYNYIFSFFQ